MSILDSKNEKHHMGALRCATKEHNENFIKYGTIKFGTPKKWEEIGITEGQGRGDKYEGTFASCDFGDIEHVKEIAEKYKVPNNDVFTRILDGRVYYKNKTSMALPVFCMYLIKFDIFNLEPKEGIQKIKGTIPGEYFRAFGDVDSKNIDDIPDKDKPSFVWVENLDEFKKRLINALCSLGINEREIIMSPVLYYEYISTGWFDFNKQFPYELLAKDTQFENQSEVRIVINTSNCDAINYLHENTIDIGDLSDIAKIVDGYFKEGIEIRTSVDLRVEE